MNKRITLKCPVTNGNTLITSKECFERMCDAKKVTGDNNKSLLPYPCDDCTDIPSEVEFKEVDIMSRLGECFDCNEMRQVTSKNDREVCHRCMSLKSTITKNPKLVVKLLKDVLKTSEFAAILSEYVNQPKTNTDDSSESVDEKVAILQTVIEKQSEESNGLKNTIEQQSELIVDLKSKVKHHYDEEKRLEKLIDAEKLIQNNLTSANNDLNESLGKCNRDLGARQRKLTVVKDTHDALMISVFQLEKDCIQLKTDKSNLEKQCKNLMEKLSEKTMQKLEVEKMLLPATPCIDNGVYREMGMRYIEQTMNGGQPKITFEDIKILLGESTPLENDETRS